MAPRANWKGYLKIAEVTCPVALYTAASTSERMAFHTVNRETGHRVHRQFIDSETGDPVEREDQVKGYGVGDDDYVILEPEEITAAVPASDKTLSVDAFIACDDIDNVYFDRPYYLAPADKNAEESFFLICKGMQAANVAAIAQTVLFRRVRTLLIRAHGPGMIATTLNYDYEVRSAREAFEDIPKMKIKGEMLDLAKHIIDTKMGEFDPREFDDRYEAALADLVKAKLEGKPIPKLKVIQPGKVIDLMEALRQSAGREKGGAGTKKAAGTSRRSAAAKGKKTAKKKAAPARRKAG
ncbi:Ku protein [Dongia soli]|uniref:Non-homologous end joining protein Ku n=1 Tax=Dongia soli TaxID=600628 RepID=A0ABU5EFQ3_9PROT|nr:Ku protein [Dongia soli]MDY0885238.1 Ku protein [Dongia soli]